MSSYERLLAALLGRGVRFVVVGVTAANYYARSGDTLFATQDRDLLLPPVPGDLLESWRAARQLGFELRAGSEPLETPADLALAERVVAARGSTAAVHPDGEQIDLLLAMAGFGFETVWRERRTFRVAELDVPVARLLHVVESKAAAGRPKDRLFLESYREILARLARADSGGESGGE